MGKGIKRIIDSNGLATGVELSDGTIIEADAVILGTGVQCATSFVGKEVEVL
jgi:NAD(P)H-nitrite reductase large subunit